MKSSPPFAASDKILLPAVLLAMPLGLFGAHRFYLQRYGTAILQALTLGGLGIWMLVDFILLVTGEFKDANGRKIRNWVTSANETEMARLLREINQKLDRMDGRVQALESLVISQKQSSKWDELYS